LRASASSIMSELQPPMLRRMLQSPPVRRGRRELRPLRCGQSPLCLSCPRASRTGDVRTDAIMCTPVSITASRSTSRPSSWPVSNSSFLAFRPSCRVRASRKSGLLVTRVALCPFTRAGSETARTISSPSSSVIRFGSRCGLERVAHGLMVDVTRVGNLSDHASVGHALCFLLEILA
jgi:hypothetical protein